MFKIISLALTATLRSRRQLVLKNIALRHQLEVLQRNANRPHLSIVHPDTVIRWHRTGWRLYWRWRSDPGRGRPIIHPCYSQINIGVLYSAFAHHTVRCWPCEPVTGKNLGPAENSPRFRTFCPPGEIGFIMRRHLLLATTLLIIFGLAFQTALATPTLAPRGRSGDGACSAISAANGQLALGRGLNVELWDAGDIANPVRLGTFALPGHVLDVSLSGTTIFATVYDGNSGNTVFFALDFTVPANPVIGDSVSFPGENFGWGFAHIGTHYYLNVYGVCHIIDLGNPSALSVVGTTRGGIFYAGAGDHLLIGTSSTLYGLDNTTPAAPVELGSWAFGGSSFINDVVITPDGNTAFVAIQGVQVVDTTNLAAMSTTNSHDYGSGADSMHLEGNRLYAVDGSGTATLLDVTNPLAISTQGVYPVADGRITYVNNMTTDPSRPAGSVLFASFNEGVVLADASVPDSVVRSSFVFTGGASSSFAFVTVVPANKLTGETTRAVSTGNRPILNSYDVLSDGQGYVNLSIATAFLFVPSLQNYLNVKSGVTVSSTVYGSKPDSVEAMEIPNGSNAPEATTTAATGGYSQDIAVSDTQVAIAEGSQPVEVFDSSLSLLGSFSPSGFLTGIAFGANFLVTVATTGSSQINVYNLPDQNGQVTPIDAFTTSLFEASAVRVVGSLLFIYNESGGCIQIYEVLGLNSVQYVNEICLPGGSAPSAVAAGTPTSPGKAHASNELFVAGFSQDLHAYDISDISNPVLLASTQTLGVVEYMEVYNGVLYTAEGSVGLGSYEISGGASGVDDEQPALPDRAFLHTNYPNPFNPSTTIRFDLPRSGEVTLEIFDVSGKLIRVLAGSTDMSAGPQEVMWHGRDEADRQVPSGVYFYRLEAAGQSETKQMVLLK
jgi:hypothetical protein